MIQKFKPVVLKDGEFTRDIEMVDQFGYVDLRIVNATGVVPAITQDDSKAYNGVDAPSAIIGKPDDIFSVKRAGDAYKAASSALSPSKESKGVESA